MAVSDVVRARISSEVKAEAAAVLAEMGLSLSDAIRIFLMKIANEKSIPFEMALTKNPEAKSKK
ncbi:type II toxin-antitoxin system RelB/DinJ family antitoxin [Alcaligenes faecalis]|uniref:type II toxin-antitoxin system RelB/DinJ family antitoxin n=1 Tax=Alcaligenes faecalis TaxID=511 RepID=UPI001B3723B6|nr:type II toxin-antitoxin system RelB/DinJ family antitoxin [Alcaligenes faecalis]MBQ0215738.1 type II toxin-antitoxin system RelB/DinJ family antitoxin [Alcaligenes faecalis]